jgi:hypothetical protein
VFGLKDKDYQLAFNEINDALIRSEKSIKLKESGGKTTGERGVQIKTGINNHIFDVRVIIEDFKKDPNRTIYIQLIILFSILKLLRAREEYIDINGIKIGDSFLRDEPSIEDLFYTLSPSLEYPIVLPAHIYELHENVGVCKEFYESQVEKRYFEKIKEITSWKIPNNLIFEKSEINSGTQILCKHYANTIGLKKLPSWL